MSSKVLRRFIILMALLTVGMFILWDVVEELVQRAPGDFDTEMGVNRMTDGLWDEALAHFDKALAAEPNHRGALMGRALVFIQTERYDAAIAELDHLIDYLAASVDADDTTGIGALAAAYANRGIVLDRQGAHERALESYLMALRTDPGAVEGPGIVNRILYPRNHVSSVRKRAEYLIEQLKLPEDQRVLRIEELDAQQRMHKP